MLEGKPTIIGTIIIVPDIKYSNEKSTCTVYWFY